MKALPHTYTVNVAAEPGNNLLAAAENLPTLGVAPPLQFDGPGDQWSPEDLLMASIASCLVLSFKAIASASNFEWISIECESSGELDKVDRLMKFTKVYTRARLTVPAGSNVETAEKLLNKADHSCLVSNSLSSQLQFECEVVVGNS